MGVAGMQKGNSTEEAIRLFRNWMNQGTTLLVELSGYEESRSTRFIVSDVQAVNTNTKPGVAPGTFDDAFQVKVLLTRVDLADGFADA